MLAARNDVLIALIGGFGVEDRPAGRDAPCGDASDARTGRVIDLLDALDGSSNVAVGAMAVGDVGGDHVVTSANEHLGHRAFFRLGPSPVHPFAR